MPWPGCELADDETWYTGTTVTTTTGVADRRGRVLSPVFNQLSVIRRRIEMSRGIMGSFVPSSTLLHIGICYRGSVPSWSSRNLMLQSFLTVTCAIQRGCSSASSSPSTLSLSSPAEQLCTPAPSVSSPTSAFSNTVFSVKGDAPFCRRISYFLRLAGEVSYRMMSKLNSKSSDAACLMHPPG